MLHFFRRITRPIRAWIKAAIFFLKVFPMLPSRPVDWVTKPPVVERVTYPTHTDQATGDLYRPATRGPHPAIVVCLGVVPFEVDHPQVPVLGNALARAGFVALLYWSPAMRDFRLNVEDVENLALAYAWLIEQPSIDPARSGLLGTCVGGSFALMAAASPHIHARVAFLAAYAPFSSMHTFVRAIASATRTVTSDKFTGIRTVPWQVDPLTRKVFVHSLTAWLTSDEAAQIRQRSAEIDGELDPSRLSTDGRALDALLTAHDVHSATTALAQLPPAMHARLDALSPLNYLADVRAPSIILLHDRGDQVIPVDESRQLYAALAGRAGVHYTEMAFQHLDPVKGHLPLHRLLRELGKFLVAVYPIFWRATR